MIENLRMALMLHLMSRGISDKGAAKVALAVHPFDDPPPVPVRAFEKPARQRSRQLSRAVGRGMKFGVLSEAEAVLWADQALRYYKQLASDIGDSYYAARYDAAIES